MDELLQFISKQSAGDVPTEEPSLPQPSDTALSIDETPRRKTEVIPAKICFGTITGIFHAEGIYELELDLHDDNRAVASLSTLDSAYPLLCGDKVKVYYLQNEDDDDDGNADETVSNRSLCPNLFSQWH